ncbi:MAG TPA: LON peptidase substrate-binding domain-containing protein [Anaeromyxobacteraceae bacterium]|nr:LON peptidase substrate-binding domain-containing protein [Anaeromyxobacteraceae bacterium]
MAERRAPGPGRAALAQACAALKVFPLSGVTVFPGTPTPLHVFEPRYRALVADALRGDRILAVPALVSAEEAMQARPPLLPLAGAGVIEQEERLPGGRYNVLVRGLGRVRLGEELPGARGYREFRAELLEDVYPQGGAAALASEMEAVGQLVLELAEVLPAESGAPRLAQAVAHQRDPAALADLVAAAAISEPGPRQRVLEELDVGRRLRIVEEEVAAVLLMLSRGRTPSA